MKTNYSYQTSLPSYKENQTGKDIQKEFILKCIAKGHNNLKSLQNITGLPQSTVSGRISDLLVDEKVKYSDFVYFEGRKRKRIVLNFKSELF